MIPSLTELILLIVIVLCIFGLGKIGAISERIGELRAKRAASLAGDESVELPPQRADGPNAKNPKPGTRRSPVDEAEVDEDSGPDDSLA